ncbi:MAG: bifunctional transaldolase/phosoglucose isomerase [Sphaerobacter sp.]|nr:bifunctional transaldolase/phosoglucose isomerase [Sphaerobacter sp.]
MANPLQRLAEVGQSFWLDNLSRALITSGELARLIQEDGLRGITSNPTIFEKALASTHEYDQDIERLAGEGKSDEEIFEALAIEDIRMAADLLRPVYDATDGADGFVSLELPPRLAFDTEGSIAEAKRLFHAVDRPNVMIKVPGTPQGIPAIERLITEGVNVNITLLFSLDNYRQVIEAYLRGLERRAAAGLPLRDVNSVASFFVSRVDTEVDRRIDELLETTTDPARRELLESLRGQVAIANAKLAYQEFRRVFLDGERFRRLQEKGARVQRPLWASTSTKNPAYSDVKYVEALIGPDTVETMAPVTVEAFRDHGVVAETVEQGVEEARQILARLAEAGIDYHEVTALLQEQGVAVFAKSYENLIKGIAEKRALLLGPTGGRSGNLDPFEDAIRSAIERLTRARFVERLWQRDPSLWSDDPQVQATIANRLGWLDVHEAMLGQIDRFTALQEDIRAAGFTRALLLGMGGSSLAPEVFQHTFGNQDGFPELQVVDTTNPDAISRLADGLDLDRTLVIVSSKSGTTVETISLFRYFHRLLADRHGAEQAGRSFIAITDPGTPLATLAREHGFRHVFLNPPDIGGRYSALSYFGLVPAAIIGLDVRALLERVAPMAARLRQPGAHNPGLWLGAALGALAMAEHDKVTFIFEPAVERLADWLEQLLAESTGKDGYGLIPVVREPRASAEGYGADRVFVGLDLVPQPHAQTDSVLEALEVAGQPVIRLRMRDQWDIGAEFLRWEVATAAAGVVLGINPFDEPNVQESKDNTNRLLAEFRTRGVLPEPPAEASEGSVALAGIPAATVVEAMRTFLDQVRLGDYVAIMAFVEPTPEVEARLQEIRDLLRDHLQVATTLGYGPRFLHSTGQLHKGGPATGAFIQIVAAPRQDLPIPGEAYAFGTLFRAQALGDFAALQRRGRPLLRLELRDDPVAGLDRVLQVLAPATMR